MTPNTSGKVEQLKIRPYARLLSMLGDQLIKNEIIALVELIKNSYDADADFCEVAFDNFSDEYVESSKSRIIISDNGTGMSYSIVTKHFLDPATPIKKQNDSVRYTKNGRICQGEKGIGRFSMLKLGKKVTVYSKEANTDVVHQLIFNFEDYDNEFLEKAGKETEVFLDELNIRYEAKELTDIPFDDNTLAKFGHGTIIVIQSLKGSWDKEKIIQLKSDLLKFSPLEIDDSVPRVSRDFNVTIKKNGVLDIYYEDEIERLRDLVASKALYKISGKYNEETTKISFKYNEAGSDTKKVVVRLKRQGEANNPLEISLWALPLFKQLEEKYDIDNQKTMCGSFNFEFYIFDFAASQAEDYGLNPEEKKLVRNLRIFLYRDDVRVQPYGSTDDDWLQIDRKRATARASQMFSNDQLIGLIKITKSNNYNLKDKTSREGIIEDGKAFEQLTTIVRTFLSLVRTNLYQTYVFSKEKRKNADEERKKTEVNASFEGLEKILINNKAGMNYVAELRSSYIAQSKAYEKRLSTTENLAGIGLSVEVASHDIMLTMDRLKDKLRDIKLDVENSASLPNRIHILENNIENAEEMFALIYMKMRDLQQIFVSSKQRPKLIKVESVIKKIQEIYSKPYKRHGITVEYKYSGKSPVMAKLIDAVLYQVFINLFDNALYWLQLIDNDRKVTITFDGYNQEVIFSDNGYGVSKSDAPYIFDAFYSGKGEDGRGLGLYIAKRLLNRNKYDIELITSKNEKVDCGANFRIIFVSENAEGE